VIECGRAGGSKCDGITVGREGIVSYRARGLEVADVDRRWTVAGDFLCQQEDGVKLL
jgi:hypothetical protein